MLSFLRRPATVSSGGRPSVITHVQVTEPVFFGNPKIVVLVNRKRLLVEIAIPRQSNASVVHPPLVVGRILRRSAIVQTNQLRRRIVGTVHYSFVSARVDLDVADRFKRLPLRVEKIRPDIVVFQFYIQVGFPNPFHIPVVAGLGIEGVEIDSLFRKSRG